MIGHYLRSALSNAVRAPFTTAAKVLTLALGLMVFITVLGVIAYWRAADRQITPAGDRAMAFTYRGWSKDLVAGEHFGSPDFLTKYIRADIPELKSVATFKSLGKVPADTGDRIVALRGANVDPQFLDIFHLPFVAGSAKTALGQEDSVILTREAANKLFGVSSPMGRRLILGGQRSVVVTGVLGPLPQPSRFTDKTSSLVFDYISVLRPRPPSPEQWTSNSVNIFAILPPTWTVSDVDKRLAQLVERRRPPLTEKDAKAAFAVIPISRITELNMRNAIFGFTGGPFSVITLFYGLGFLVLVVACLNYANLATAQTVARTREIGMRRVLGAGPAGILLQSWLEAGLTTVAAALVAMAGLALAGPAITAQSGVAILPALFSDPGSLAKAALVLVGVSLAAALYPAFLVSRTRPVDALRSSKVRGRWRGVGEVLIGLQFASASALLIAILIVGQQNAHLRRLALGQGGDPVVVLPPQSSSGIPIGLWRQQLAAYPQIKAVGESSSPPFSESQDMTKRARRPQDLGASPFVDRVDIGFGYLEAYSYQLLAGRLYSEDRGAPANTPPASAAPPVVSSTNPVQYKVGPRTDPRIIVIDRAFSERLGFASPQAAIGQRLYPGSGEPDTIIGVVETKAHHVQAEGDNATFYGLNLGDTASDPQVRISAQDVDGGLAVIKQVWGQLAPNQPFSYQFDSQIFEETFLTFASIGRLFLILSVTALLISSIGLFGMAAHVTQRRLHEIAVRKTLGSSGGEIVRLLLTDFSKPVVIANLIAWPLAYWAAKTYLAGFPNRIDLTPLPFVGSLLITLAIAWFAVGGQTFHAARVRPAQVLRDA